MTAKEFLDGTDIYPGHSDGFQSFYENKEIVELLQIFTKIKCQELLEIVSEKANGRVKYLNGQAVSALIDKKSILNAVNLDEFIC